MEASAQFFPAQSPFAHLGPAPGVAYNSDAPEDEVLDAGREVMEDYYQAPMPGLSDIVGQMLHLRNVEETGSRLMAKALHWSQPGAEEPKAETRAWNSRVAASGLYLPKAGLNFSMLRQLSTRIEVARAIHNTLGSQVQRFASISQKNDAMGWKVTGHDPYAEITPDKQEFNAWLQQFLSCGGREFDAMARRKGFRESFRTFLGKLIEDTLTLDHVAVETVPLKAGDGIDSFWVRDGATFYLATRPERPGDPMNDDIFAYQVCTAGATPQRQFKFEELSIFQRNVTSDLEWGGYGRSELESSVNSISMFIQAIAHTAEGIDSNAIPKGFLTIFGQFDRRTQDAFKSAWQAQLRGVRNAWNLPVLFARNGQAAAQFTQTGTPFSEMAFAKWIQLQSAIMCSIYGIDPLEIGLESWTAGKSTLSGDDTSEKLALSKNKGLVPLMTHVEGYLSENILARFSPDSRFAFTGIADEDAKAKADLTKTVSTINELRKNLDMPPHPLAWFGDLPADADLLSAEFQRVQSSATFNEGRRIWGGLEPFPDERVGMNPLNPSMGASWNQVLQSAAPQEQPQPGEEGQDPFGQYQEDPNESNGEEEGEDQAPPEQDEQDQEQEAPGPRHQEMSEAFEGMK